MILTRKDTEQWEAMVAEYVADTITDRDVSLPDVIGPLIDCTEDVGDPHVAAVLSKALSLGWLVAPVHRAGVFLWFDSVIEPWENRSRSAVPNAVWSRLSGEIAGSFGWYKSYPTAIDALRDLGRVLLEPEAEEK